MIQTAVKLTPTEKEVAQLLADGLSEKEIAEKLETTVPSVTSYLSRCRIKTNSPTNRALILLFKKPSTEIEKLRQAEAVTDSGAAFDAREENRLKQIDRGV